MLISPRQLLFFALIALVTPGFIFAQSDASSDLPFEVNRVLPYIHVTQAQLHEAQSIADLNTRYKPEWVQAYLSVEITTQHDGQPRITASANDILSQEQKNNLQRADAGSNIAVHIRYIPENTLRNNEPREIDFTFIPDPHNDAEFTGGQPALMQYLQEKAMGSIPNGLFTGYDFAAVQFVIDEDGVVCDVHLFESSEDEAIDELLVDAIRNMPCWEPATYSNGVKIRQEFALTVGSQENCMINLLSVRKL